MPTRAVFHCQFCDAVPDHGTQRSLAGQVSERMFGEYLDAFPGRWLVWNGGGPLGPRRYACREHRGDLVAYLRYHYATVAAQVWKMPPYTQRWPDEKRPHMGGSMGIIKFGLRGGLLQDRPADEVVPRGGEPPPPAPAVPPGGTPAQQGPARGTPAQQVPDSGTPAQPDAAPVAGDAGRPTADEIPSAGADPGPAPARDEPGRQPDSSDSAAAPGVPGPDRPPAPAGPADASATEDMFPPGELLGPDEWYPAEELFPPGQLFLPTDGLFGPAAGGGSEAPPSGEAEDGPWPPDESGPDEDGPWPAPPDHPPA